MCYSSKGWLMVHDFSYTKEGEYYALQKNTFPRFIAIFNYKTPLPELINLKILDNCDAKDMAKAFMELDVYMKSIRKILR